MKMAVEILAEWLGSTRRGATCPHGGRLSKVEACTPFCAGEEAQVIREREVAMGGGSQLRLFTFEVLLRLRRLSDRACLVLN